MQAPTSDVPVTALVTNRVVVNPSKNQLAAQAYPQSMDTGFAYPSIVVKKPSEAEINAQNDAKPLKSPLSIRSAAGQTKRMGEGAPSN